MSSKRINAVIDVIATQNDGILVSESTDSGLYVVDFDPKTGVYSVEFSKAINRIGETDHYVYLTPIVNTGPVKQGQEVTQMPMTFAVYKSASESQIYGKKVIDKPQFAGQVSFTFDLNKIESNIRPIIKTAQFTMPKHDTKNQSYFRTRQQKSKAYVINEYTIDESDQDQIKLKAKLAGKDKNNILYSTQSSYPKCKPLKNNNNISMYYMGIIEIAREIIAYLSSASSIANGNVTNWTDDAFDDE